jgi:BCD family chlorophyll transporter-like MFS transporter
MAGLVACAWFGSAWPFKATVFALGVANGAFSIAAIGSMMQLAGERGDSRAGVRMGLWGAAQAVAFGLGGLLGTGASDLAQAVFRSPAAAYGCVFALEALMFLVAAVLAVSLGGKRAVSKRPSSERPPYFSGAVTPTTLETTK